MGLFGRDDRAPESTPPQTAAARPAAPRPSSGATLIARTSRFEGVLSGSSDILIEGEMKGEIGAAAAVTISESGSVEAEIHARSVVVAGTVRGDLAADEKIELSATANVEGNITSPRILIREGATFEGQVFMKDPKRRPAGAKGSGPDGHRKHGPQPKQGDGAAAQPGGGASQDGGGSTAGDSNADGGKRKDKGGR